ncbi:MAG: hypothetical protein LBS84_12140 [Clostridiales bacterium]|jgi:hypothetical protein|nr:hypothetical protein [Clostridiales bacterium]
MSEINFLEPEGKEPEKSNFGRLFIIILLIVAAVAVAFLTLRKTIELSTLEKEKSTMNQFIESADTIRQIAVYREVQDEIAEVKNKTIPITNAYTTYKILNTATGPLIDRYVWAPIKANPDTMEFQGLTIAGNNLTVNAVVRDTGVMRQYMTDLAGMTTVVDKDNIDKIQDAAKAEGDKEIDRFKNPFTVEIIGGNTDLALFEQPFLGQLKIFINKDITQDMFNLLGKVPDYGSETIEK